MKYFSKIFFNILIMCSFALLIAQENNEEFRATWVVTWEHISSSSSAEANKTHVREILDNHKTGNLNAVLWHARQSGTAYYNSSYEPWGFYAGYSNPGYDPLAYAIEEAHKRGLELHAWFNVFACASTHEGAPAQVHPDWVCRDQDGILMDSHRALSPGLEAVREYTLDVAMEIVSNYDIDGIHLDFIRWNEYSNSKLSSKLARLVDENRMLDGMITDEQIQDLIVNKSGRYLYDIDHPYSAGIPEGFSSWEDWWRWSVTEFVQMLHDSIQAVKPWVRLSVAALGKYNWSGWQGYGTVYQDAALWFNEGYIDQLTPMHYHWTTSSGFYDMLVGGGDNSWGYWIQEGINAGRLFSVGPGSYVFAENNVWYRHPEVIETCRTIDWIDGFQFFSYGSWNGYQYWDEAGNTFFNHKTKIRDTQLIDNIPPEAPSLSLQKIDSLHYQITVTPPGAESDNQWFAVYRSEDNDINVDNDEIIDIHFGDSIYAISDNFDGLQDFNGTYHYSATMLDRYWNESIPSNTEAGE
ncbi:MAG: family 10 glycosylhydrolase, partial [Candidatus Marinimicrobia bacterium]|nr:family 10 glycosylhydrolase [Candidatus Neomarinimicrobiota bacterium]